MKQIDALMTNLAENLKDWRDRRGLTQSELSRLASIPRSTLAHLESGESNPTLSVLTRLALGLRVSLEELLRARVSQVRKFNRESLPSTARGAVDVRRLLPDHIPGMEMDRFVMEPSSRLKGSSHQPGTREYLFCEKGQITLQTLGEDFVVNSGELVAFAADKNHSYKNSGRGEAIGFSLVTLSPLAV